RVKICGITNEADAALAAELGADAIGLNFYAPSPRCVTIRLAQKILAGLPSAVDPIAVHVNEEPSAIAEQLRRLPCIQAVPWHAGCTGACGWSFVSCSDTIRNHSGFCSRG